MKLLPRYLQRDKQLFKIQGVVIFGVNSPCFLEKDSQFRREMSANRFKIKNIGQTDL